MRREWLKWLRNLSYRGINTCLSFVKAFPPVCVPTVVKFYTNFTFDGKVVMSKIGGFDMEFDVEELGLLLNIPSLGFDNYLKKKCPVIDNDVYTGIVVTKKFSQKFELDASHKVYKTDMTPFHKLLFQFVNSCILQRSESRHEATLLDMAMMEILDTGRPINLPSLMIQYMERAGDTSKPKHDDITLKQYGYEEIKARGPT
nr:uncharacterized protein LOC117278344 [Nicotiana tomentosiformis]